jgi:DNA-directed RNA polymerase subunit RPC12/RpoP
MWLCVFGVAARSVTHDLVNSSRSFHTDWADPMAKQIVKSERMEVRRQIGNRRWKTPTPTPAAGRVYVVAHACFTCRKSFKLSLLEGAHHPCPQCRSRLFEMGRSFKAPRANDIEQWEKVQGLYALGFRFWSYGRGQPPALPERLRDLQSFVADNPQHPCRIADRDETLIPLSLVGTI